MSNAPDQVTVTLTGDGLEALLRRIVREELTRLLAARRSSLRDDWSHEGSDDPEGDAALLADVLALIEREQATPAAVLKLLSLQREKSIINFVIFMTMLSFVWAVPRGGMVPASHGGNQLPRT
jgi:hypothetical protein